MRKIIPIFCASLLLFGFRLVNRHAEKKDVPMASNKVLIILQENTGKLDVLPTNTPKEFKSFFTVAVDRIAETFEDVKSDLQGSTKYEKVIHLTDVNCTKAKLLATLIQETINGNEIDIFSFGHGNPDNLVLHNENLTGGVNGSIRKLLTDAKAQKGSKFNFNLRLVYMCQCYGATTNDDWLAIGAKVSVGSKCLNFMAEPMITLFVNKYVNENKTVAVAAAESFNEAKTYWTGANTLVPQLGYATPPAPGFGCVAGESKYETSRPVVAGTGSTRFSSATGDITLASLVTNPSFRTVGNLLGTTADDELKEGVYYIKSAAGNKYLDVSGSCLDEALCKVQLWDLGQSTSNNKWVVTKVDGVLGGYTLKCVANNKYLDADLAFPGGNLTVMNVFENGCGVNVASRLAVGLPRTNQEWKIVPRGNGTYTIKCIMSGLYVDAVNNCVNTNGCKIQLWEDYDHLTRKWKFVKAN